MVTLVFSPSGLAHLAVKDDTGKVVGTKCRPGRLPKDCHLGEGEGTSCHRCRPLNVIR